MTRPITNDDIWSAVRGLELFSKDPNELKELIEAHEANELFASKVIVSAASQVLATKKART